MKPFREGSRSSFQNKGIFGRHVPHSSKESDHQKLSDHALFASREDKCDQVFLKMLKSPYDT